MLAIEAKRVFKDGTIIFIVLAALFAGIIATDQDAYLAPALEIFLLLYASFTGWSMFERERQENAMEYMLSLPLSRRRLLLLKFLPRLLNVAIMLLIYLRLHQSWQLPSFLSPNDFIPLYTGFFLLSFAFSISLKNFISAFFLTCLLSIGQTLMIMLLDNSLGIGQAILQANITVLVFPFFFILLFHGFDIKPVNFFNKKFFPGLLLLSGLIAGFVYLNTPIRWKNYYLTQNGLVMRNACAHSEILLGHAWKRLSGCLTVLRESEDGNTLFCLTREPQADAPCLNKNIIALDLKTGAAKTVFEIEPGWTVSEGYPGQIGQIQNNRFSLFMQNHKLNKAMLLEIQAEKTEKFPIQGDFEDRKIDYIFYLPGQPRQLVIFSEKHLYKLHESGQVEELARADSFAVWRDKILLFTPDGFHLYRVGEQLTPLLQKNGNFKKSLRKISGYESRGVIFQKERTYFHLDMERLLEEKLELKFSPFTYQQSGETFNIISASGSIFTIRSKGSGKQNEQVWDAGFQPAGIRVFASGLLVFKDQNYKVQPFNAR